MSRVRVSSLPPYAQIAQSVEQGTENPCVRGSIPRLGTILNKLDTVISNRNSFFFYKMIKLSNIIKILILKKLTGVRMYSIFKDVPYKEIYKGEEFSIEGIEFDSRKIKNNYVFIAMVGSAADGHDFIQMAIDNGAGMIIVEKEIYPEYYRNYRNVTFVFVKDVRKHLGIIASNYFDYPQNNLKIIGITGTNGKTTSSYILENILEMTARIGTTGNRILDKEFPTDNTTPESLELIKLINESVIKGVKYFIMEVSSHALEIGRVNGLCFDSAIFTNLSQDHLDFHGTMKNYFNAKRKIFSMMRDGRKGVINIDDEYGDKIYNEDREKYISVSIKNKDSDLYGEIVEYTNDGMKLEVIIYRNSKYILDVNLVGEYNLYNILGCIASCLSLGLKIEEILKKLSHMKPVPGRFETIRNNRNVRIVIDFAHTDDGLRNVGDTLRDITENRVITLFGAGGDRDNAKRPKMAKAAAEFSDFIILTSDNPRTENPEEILRQIEKGLKDINYPKEKYIIIKDREKAIKYAIENIISSGDSLLVAGKGHETYQIIGKEKLHFDDKEVVKKYLI